MSTALSHASTSAVLTFFARRGLGRLQAAYGRLNAESADLPGFVLTLSDGSTYRFGDAAPAFEISVRDKRGLLALASLDETRACESLMAGSIDFEGEMLELLRLRPLFADRHPLQAYWYKALRPLLFGQARSDEKWIAEHYDEDADFYELFLDSRRCYSHGIFADDDEALDDAILRKLDFALDAVGARPGQRILDIGAGWGTMVEHAGRQGIDVTSLTISEPSERYVAELVARQELPCRVVRQHFHDYRSEERFDAIVNLGVTEHLPDYAASLAQYGRLLKPGGRVYLDACSAPTKFPFASFTYRYIFPGNATPMCLHDYLAAVAETPFEVIAVHNDRHSYELTCRRWAESLEQGRDEIVRRWGKGIFRRFQLYLWGCVDVFARGKFGAYRVILELPERPDPR
jgi:cyclopropane-fatty-acyl-phospholipid synthase